MNFQPAFKPHRKNPLNLASVSQKPPKMKAIWRHLCTTAESAHPVWNQCCADKCQFAAGFGISAKAAAKQLESVQNHQEFRPATSR